MSQAHSLEFSTFFSEGGTYTFQYAIDGDDYAITLSHSSAPVLSGQPLRTTLFNLGMCYLIDLAELLNPKEITINFSLSDLQLEFWRTLYEEVSKEKMYIYRLNLQLLTAKWSTAKDAERFESFSTPRAKEYRALCLTGGKESLTLLKLLETKKDLLLFFLNPETNVHRQKVFNRVKDEFHCIKTSSNRYEVLAVLKEKYQTGLGSGVDMAHLVFNTLLFDCRYVMIGNEYSSNFPNFIYQGFPINHQYIKSVYFAQKLNRYLHAFVTPDFHYYSPFFGLYEFKIAQELFRDKKYLEVWTSCNQTTEQVNFCSHCSKCAFTYLISSLYTTEEFLREFFSRDLLEDVDLFQSLVDFTGEKPLDCVGEKIEVWVALEQLLTSSVHQNKPVVTYYKTRIRPFIASDLEKFKKEVNSIQTVPVELPAELSELIQRVYG